MRASIDSGATSAVAPALDTPVLIRQDWTPVLFLHWRIPLEAAARFMPRHVKVDEYEGRTFVGLVMTAFDRTRVLGAPLPYLGAFRQMNVRLYSVDGHDRHGVVFIRLDASRLPAVAIGRLLTQPFHWSRLTADAASEAWTVGSWTHEGSTVATVSGRRGPPVARDPLEHWLTNRWGAHARLGPATVWGRVAHPTWSFHEYSVHHLHAPILSRLGLPVDGPPDVRSLWSAGVRASLAAPVPVASSQSGRPRRWGSGAAP